MIRFDSFEDGSRFKKQISAINPAAKVPVLDDAGLIVWDTQAIAEYVAERFPEKNLWPRSVNARARARSVCAEMHSGFGALRSACPMNIEADLAETGERVWRDEPAVRADVARITAMWQELLDDHKGRRTAGPPQGADATSGGRETKATVGAHLLFGDFSIADAFFAPVCMRLKSYALPVPAEISAYVERLCALPGVQAWVEEALAEKDFREFEEA